MGGGQDRQRSPFYAGEFASMELAAICAAARLPLAQAPIAQGSDTHRLSHRTPGRIPQNAAVRPWREADGKAYGFNMDVPLAIQVEAINAD